VAAEEEADAQGSERLLAQVRVLLLLLLVVLLLPLLLLLRLVLTVILRSCRPSLLELGASMASAQGTVGNDYLNVDATFSGFTLENSPVRADPGPSALHPSSCFSRC